tara:strand:+ start:1281 stop:1994 length:714 start_codon:yes stop_codon:yes gene_type:complete
MSLVSLDPVQPENFNWASIDPRFIEWEVFTRRIYDEYHAVEEGDVVVDIGASCGPFSYTAAARGAKKIYLVEPSKELLKTAMTNLSDFMINDGTSCTFINHAVSSQNRETIDTKNSHVYGSNLTHSSIKFSKLIHKYDIKHIDYLKIDCEGGEYDIFTDENIHFLANNVDFIAAEIHTRNIDDGEKKFLNFRDNYLKYFKQVNIITGDGENWESQLFNDDAILNILRRTELMFYIKK